MMSPRARACTSLCEAGDQCGIESSHKREKHGVGEGREQAGHERDASHREAAELEGPQGAVDPGHALSDLEAVLLFLAVSIPEKCGDTVLVCASRAQ
jgi:hypothetical protein